MLRQNAKEPASGEQTKKHTQQKTQPKLAQLLEESEFVVMSETAEAINAKLEKLVPEIAASKYGKYPMQGSRWLAFDELDPDGKPTYLKEPDVGAKTNYAYSNGAYYHLLTKAAYRVLYNRLMSSAPSGLCSCFSSVEARQELNDYDKILQILFNRTKASIPDDAQAAKDAITDARNLAEAQSNMVY